jgi:hypothetical protein
VRSGQNLDSVDTGTSAVGLCPPVILIGQADHHTIPHTLASIPPVAPPFLELGLLVGNPRHGFFLFLVSQQGAADYDNIHCDTSKQWVTCISSVTYNYHIDHRTRHFKIKKLKLPSGKAITALQGDKLEKMMDISSVSTSTMAVAGVSQQVQTVMETQVAMLRELAESQQQIAQLLVEGGLGQNIDVSV